MALFVEKTTSGRKYKVKDMSQAVGLGIELAEVEMPGLMACRTEFGPSQTRARRESLDLNGFQFLSAAVGLVQTMTKQGSEGVGVGEGKMKIISLFVSIALSGFAAAMVLPLRYTDILCRISYLFLVLACSSLLSPVVPHGLFWFPYVAPVFPLLGLLQLTPATLQAYLQRLCCSPWIAIRDFACGAHQRLIRTTTSSTKDHSELSTVTTSSPPPCGGLEEGCDLKGRCSWEQGSFKRSREQFVSGSTLCSTGSIIIYAENFHSDFQLENILLDGC